MNGSLAGGAAIVAGGQTGNAVSLAGGASVNINNPITDLGAKGNWTVSAWVKTATPGATILTKGDGGWANGNTIFYLGDGTAGGSGGIPSGVRYAGGFFQGSTGATSVNNNAWRQVTYVNSGGNYSLYVDGVAQPLSAGNASFGNADVGSIVRLGVSTNTVPADGTVNFNGLMDNVQFYNQALTAGQIAALHQGARPFGSLPSSTNVSIASGATLDLNGATQQIGSLTGATGATVAMGGGQLVVNSTADTQFAGSITGVGGAFTKQGAGVLTLTGANAYTGATTIGGGVLRLGTTTPASITGSAVANYAFESAPGGVIANAGAGGAAMDGTLAGGAALVPGGHDGNAVSLAGGASVNINNPITNLSNTTAWSVTAWVKTSATGASILTKGDGGWANGNTIFYLGDGTAGGSGAIPSAVRYAGGFFQGSPAATPVANNAWHQVTYVNNAGTYAIYVDGIAQPLSPGNTGFGNADVGSIVRLGVSTNTVPADGTVNFNGLLDDVQFYSYALTPSQIAALYQGTNGGSLPSGTAVAIASGATLDVNGLNQQIASLVGPSGAAVTLGSGQLIVSGAASTEFAGSIAGIGGSLVKHGVGTLTLSGANTYTGMTLVNGGALNVAGSLAGPVSVLAPGILQGAGSITGSVTLDAGGTLAPGSSPGALSVGSLTTNPGSQIQLELAGTGRGTQYDAILVGGNAVLGGTLSVSLLSGFVPLAGESFDVFDWTSQSGEFAALDLPALNPGLAWDTSQLYSIGVLKVASLLAADFNADGRVDGADLGLWKIGYGTSSGATKSQGDANGDGQVDGADLLVWQQQLQSAGEAGTASAVPEPDNRMLALVLAIATMSFASRANTLTT
jgi:autotransporter-associated beta strand protein